MLKIHTNRQLAIRNCKERSINLCYEIRVKNRYAEGKVGVLLTLIAVKDATLLESFKTYVLIQKKFNIALKINN